MVSGRWSGGSSTAAAGRGRRAVGKTVRGRVQGFQRPQGQGCSPGPRVWGAQQERAVTCAQVGVAWRTACGCAAATYGDLTAIFVREATARAEPETFVTPRSTLRHVGRTAYCAAQPRDMQCHARPTRSCNDIRSLLLATCNAMRTQCPARPF